MAARLISQVRLSTWSLVSRRAITTGAALSAKGKPASDPVKQLFMDKIKEYQTEKSKSGEAPGLRPEDKQQLENELVRLKNIYGGDNLSEFPTFNFKEDVKIDWR